MTPTIRLILLAFAFVLFTLAGLNIAHPRVNLIAMGLALVTLVFLLT